MKTKSLAITTISALIIALGAAGCGFQESAPPNKETEPVKKEPITLVIYGNISKGDTEFEKYFIGPIRQKFPHITLEIVDKSVTAEQILSSGTMIDLIYASPPQLITYQELDMIEDLDAYVMKYGMSLQNIDQKALEMIRLHTQNKLLGLPLYMNFSALFYNKDIFDKFGVSYPKNGMTWDQVIELAKQMTRSVDGIQFRGLDPGVLQPVTSQLALAYYDPKTEKAFPQPDQWKKAFQLMEDIYGISGNRPPQATAVPVRNSFFVSKNLAMMADWGINTITQLADMAAKGQSMNWDMVSLPAFKENPGISRKVDAHLLMVAKNSKYKDDAFQVIQYMLSDEVQLQYAKSGRIPSLKTVDLPKYFGVDSPVLKGKNLEVVYKYNPAPQYLPSIYDNVGINEINSAYTKVYTGTTDINNALREAEELANRAIAALKKR